LEVSGIARVEEEVGRECSFCILEKTVEEEQNEAFAVTIT
jgi:hypothetical protein